MAITGTACHIFREIAPMLPRGGSLLEIGEANWYGEVEPDFPCRDKSNWFAIVKDFYADLFAPSRVVSVDINGSPDALRHDLNAPLPLDEQFDLVINHGTAEHVLNIGQVFKSMHDMTIAGGLMIHDAPFTGWIDHGFYTLQPTLFYDLAAANGYEVCRVYITEIRGDYVQRVESRDSIPKLAEEGKIPMNAALFVVLRKLFDQPFRLPFQGYYAQTLSPAGQRAWSEMR